MNDRKHKLRNEHDGCSRIIQCEFEREELARLARDAGFTTSAHTAPLYVHSETENRMLGLRLQRSFIHVVFRK